jgi:hypothetical protein
VIKVYFTRNYDFIGTWQIARYLELLQDMEILAVNTFNLVGDWKICKKMATEALNSSLDTFLETFTTFVLEENRNSCPKKIHTGPNQDSNGHVSPHLEDIELKTYNSNKITTKTSRLHIFGNIHKGFLIQKKFAQVQIGRVTCTPLLIFTATATKRSYTR